MSFFQVEDISISFGGVKAVSGVSFSVDEGEIFTIIGPNGAGKTTIFNLISLINRPHSGQILFEGKDLTQTHPSNVPRYGIARTFQNIELFEHESVLQNLLVGRHLQSTTRLWEQALFLPRVRREEYINRKAVEDVIDFLDLQHYRDSVVQNLPYGVRKVVELGRALCIKPKLLLLDEPSSGLNVEETDDMAFWIEDIRKQLKITVLVIEHNMNLVNRISDRVLAVNQGEVLALGSPGEVQSHPEVISAYLGKVEDVK